jgi:hypothetical protein
MRGTTRVRMFCIGLTVLAVVFAVYGSSALAVAGSIIINSGEIKIDTGDDGAKTARVTFINLADAPVDVKAAMPAEFGRVTGANRESLPARRQTEVTFTLETNNIPAGGVELTLQYGQDGADGRDVVNVLPGGRGVDWTLLRNAFFIGLGASVLICLAMTRFAQKKKKGLDTVIRGLGTDWSFKDNWVSGVTAGAGVLAGLLGGTGVLKSIIGSDPGEDALALLAIAGAASAILIGLAPLFVKMIGDNSSEPTVGGTLAAALVTLTGTLGEIAVLTWQGAKLVSESVSPWLLVFGAFVFAVVARYAWVALKQLIMFKPATSAVATPAPRRNSLL